MIAAATPARASRIAVCGPGEASPADVAAAEAVGRLLAAAGCVVVCGGLGGVMAAVCRGAKGAGGLTIGILPGYDAADANRWVDVPVGTGMGQARNAVVVATAQVVIAVGGGFGTLSEIALALRLRRPVVLLGGWADALTGAAAQARIERLGGRVETAATPEAAVTAALALLGGDGR